MKLSLCKCFPTNRPLTASHPLGLSFTIVAKRGDHCMDVKIPLDQMTVVEKLRAIVASHEPGR